MKKPLFASCCIALVAASVQAAPPEWVLPIDLEKAAAHWSFETNQIQVVVDAVSKAPAFQGALNKGRPGSAAFTSVALVAPPCVLEADVRFPLQEEQKAGGRASLGLVAEDDSRFLVSAGPGRDEVSYVAGAVTGGGRGAEQRFTPVHPRSGFSPVMQEHARSILERRADLYPLAHLRRHRLRLEVRENGLRYYVNGRLVQEHDGPVPPSRASLRADGGALVLSARVRPLENVSPAFVPVPLDDHCNAASPGKVQGMNREPGRISTLNGVPLIASVGNGGEDHLDVGPSLFIHRMGTMREAESREAVHPPEAMDATRFTLRVPPRTYRRAWVLAAFDGDPLATPELTLRFYKPKTPWNVDAAVEVPSYEAKSGPKGARRVAFAPEGGKAGALWLIPVELDAAALAAEPMECVELTKKILPYRGWPDPAYYNAYPGGLPSGVHVYALTLEEAPVWARGTGTATGNFYAEPEKPVWNVLVKNLSAKPVEAEATVTVTDPYGESTVLKQRASLPVGGDEQKLVFKPAVAKYGLHRVKTEVRSGDFVQSRDGAFLHLPRDTRKADKTNSPWGLWNWGQGTHGTGRDAAENMRLNKMLGAVNNYNIGADFFELRKKSGVGAEHYRLLARNLPPWSAIEPVDAAQAAAFADEKGKEAVEQLRLNPDLQYVNVFAENSLSLRLTHGMPAWATGQEPFVLDETESTRLRSHWQSAKAAAQGVRKHAPKLKFIFGHGAGCFALPFFALTDWDASLFDGFGMDLPQFERMPERQPRATEPSLLFFLRKAMRDLGIADKEVVHLESYFPPNHPMALTAEEQSRLMVRTAVLSMSLGTTKFMRNWSLYTCSDGWGGSHYGSAGVIDRAPEFNAKPGAAAFATMTRILDLARYDGYVETGSRSAFCLRFKDKDRLVYAVWTIRGTRSMELAVDGGATMTRYDESGNAFPVEIKEGRGAVTLDPGVQWLVMPKGAIASVALGQPVHVEAPAPVSDVLEDFEKRDWKTIPGVHERYQNNHWDMPREPGEMRAGRVADAARGSQAFRVELVNAQTNKPMVGFYGIFEPPKPIDIPGKPRALGLWVNGRSAWNRFIYQVVDAKGETWISVGTKDAWNCDDIHSWSSINHDGWRYMRFPLPGNAPGDDYRECDSTWWGSDADGVFDLPVKLARVMIEMRPQMIYADQMLPVDDLSIELDDLTVEYETADDRTDAPVRLQRAAAGVLEKGAAPKLPNPYAALQRNPGPRPEIAAVRPPDDINNGTRLFVEIKPVVGAKAYKGWVSAHADGRGAQPLGLTQQSTGSKLLKSITAPNLVLFDGLRPATPMYVFVTAVGADDQESKPSAIRRVVLRDEFPFQ